MRYLSLIACAMCLMPVLVHAQIPPLSLASGESVTLTLMPDAMQELRFSAQAGDWLSLQIQGVGEAHYEGAGLGIPSDPTFTLLSPEGLELKYVDDTPEGGIYGTGTHGAPQVPAVLPDAVLQAFVLPQTGEYRLRVDSFSGVTQGDVQVTLNLTPVSAQALDWDFSQTALSVRLAPSRSRLLRLPLALGESVRLIARDVTGTLDPVLQVLDEQGIVLAENDDAPPEWLIGEGLNVLDAGMLFSAPAEGIYTLQLGDYLGRSGELEVQIKRG